jgi:hypothetical protein
MFAEALDQRRATLSVTLRPEGGKIIEIAATKPGCARIRLFVENGDPSIYLTVGENTSFEITLRGIWKEDLEALEDTIAIIQAVVDGRFEETIRTRRGQLVKSYGKLWIRSPRGERLIDMPGSGPGWNPFRRGDIDEQHTEYLPWDVDLSTADLDPE